MLQNWSSEFLCAAEQSDFNGGLPALVVFPVPLDRNRGSEAKFSSIQLLPNHGCRQCLKRNSQSRKSRLGEYSITMGVDRQLTFEILLYLNIFYFGLYAGMEAIFLLMKYYYVADMDNLTMLNEVFLLLALTGLESARLYLGQEENIHKKISVVFRILLLTVPAQYLTLYFTFWQTKVTQVQAAEDHRTYT